MSRRIGILGGTFDPIHRGHVDLGLAAQTALHLDRLLMIPSHIPPHRSQTFASAFHRFAMVALAVRDRRTWRASDLELRHETPSFTSNTLQRFHERGYRPEELFFVIGADAFADIVIWRDFPAILEATNFAVVSRPGHPVDALPRRLHEIATRMVTHLDPFEKPSIILIDADTADVSSSAIRRLRSEARPITGLVDVAVQQHIEQHGLYTPQVPDRREGSSNPQSSGR